MSMIPQQIFDDAARLPPELQKEALDFIQFLKSRLTDKTATGQDIEPNGTRLASLLKEASEKNLFSDIQNPAEWQREIRRDRPLPGRED
jgi:hypothetical protein